MDDEFGYLEARRDRFGPFVQVRWRQMQMAVRDTAWSRFVHEVSHDIYTPEMVSDRRGWVRFEIDEGFGWRERPVGWRPKRLEIPEGVWKRFADAVRELVFAEVRHEWRPLS
ncbi:hypothetical protein ACFOY2_34685 [Nonomuraea purpurea]|uniref:Uncharacterized protein n=1 Tax=Nonomuraea purpurea TaxID=1849276 RepID=A0ABV8GEN4_9ACTN